MKIHAIFRTFLYALGVVLASAQYAPGAEPDAARPLELRRIMNELSRNMQLVTDAIAREDWALVEKTAPLIGSFCSRCRHTAARPSIPLRKSTGSTATSSRICGITAITPPTSRTLAPTAATRPGARPLP